MKTVEQRFWAKVDTSGPIPEHRPELGSCWIWKGAKNPKGYGKLGVSGRIIGAHQVSYALTFGAVPDHQYVCHHCDNPRCERPMHLFLGTPKDNSQDRDRKNRGVQGLTAIQVADIKSRFERGERAAVLADEYGVRVRQTHRILNGQRSGNLRKNMARKLPVSPLDPTFTYFNEAA